MICHPVSLFAVHFQTLVNFVREKINVVLLTDRAEFFDLRIRERITGRIVRRIDRDDLGVRLDQAFQFVEIHDPLFPVVFDKPFGKRAVRNRICNLIGRLVVRVHRDHVVSRIQKYVHIRKDRFLRAVKYQNVFVCHIFVKFCDRFSELRIAPGFCIAEPLLQIAFLRARFHGQKVLCTHGFAVRLRQQIRCGKLV